MLPGPATDLYPHGVYPRLYGTQRSQKQFNFFYIKSTYSNNFSHPLKSEHSFPPLVANHKLISPPSKNIDIMNPYHRSNFFFTLVPIPLRRLGRHPLRPSLDNLRREPIRRVSRSSRARKRFQTTSWETTCESTWNCRSSDPVLNTWSSCRAPAYQMQKSDPSGRPGFAE
jgi:hypothetical protein